MIEAEVEVDNCEAFLEQLSGKNDTLRQLNKEIESYLKVYEYENEIIVIENEKVIECKVKLQRRIKDIGSKQFLNFSRRNSIEQPVNSPPVFHNVGNRSVELPKLSVSKFYGDHSNYLEFWEQYRNSIHNNPSLSKIDKFCYLKSLL